MVELKTYKGSDGGKIVESSINKDIGSNEVLIKVTHSGLCGTDVHYKSADMALGHEGVGTVEKVGDKVSLFKVGDRAGWGYCHYNCGHCKQCYSGRDIFCDQRKMYGEADLDQGSLASHAVWSEEWLYHIPEDLASEHAAPLMCGGATVFSPLHCYGVKSTDRVGIIGIGGLGHLAIQFAAKMGCEVVVFSGTESKKEEATKLGAKEFYAVKDVKDLSEVVKDKLDHLIVTTAAQPDWSLYIPIMVPGSTIFPLSVSQDDLKIPYMPLLVQNIRIQGSIIATRQVHREMLRFAAVHKIQPIVQTFPLNKEGIEQAFEALEGGKMRYRGVLVA